MYKEPAHMTWAHSQMGELEIPGSEDNPTIVGYFEHCSYNASNDETPWCAAFVNAGIERSGGRGTYSAAALSFINWGIKASSPQYGDVAVLDYGNKRGHVGFYVGEDMNGRVGLLGGNQDNQVKVSWFDKDNIREYRRSKQWHHSNTIRIAAAGGTLMTVGTAINVATGGDAPAVAAKVAQDAAPYASTMDTVSAGAVSIPQIVDTINTVGGVLQHVPVVGEYVMPITTAVTSLLVIAERLRKLRKFNQ